MRRYPSRLRIVKYIHRQDLFVRVGRLMRLQLNLTTLNSTKSAYASFTLIGNKFFSKYQYMPVRGGRQTVEKFTCRIYNKVRQWASLTLVTLLTCCQQALLSVFKGRPSGDASRERDTAIERCDVSIEDGDGKTKSRFIVKIICRHGTVRPVQRYPCLD